VADLLRIQSNTSPTSMNEKSWSRRFSFEQRNSPANRSPNQKLSLNRCWNNNLQAVL